MAGNTSKETAPHIQHENTENSRMFQNGTIVQEMTKASGWDDVKSRTQKFLESFEKKVIGNFLASTETYFKAHHQFCIYLATKLSHASRAELSVF